MSKKVIPVMESTHSVFVSVIILAQCFGMFPVSEIKKDNYKVLHFKWKTAKVYLALTLLCMLLINCGFQLYSICVLDRHFYRFGK